MKATHKASENESCPTNDVIHASSREECDRRDRARVIPIGVSSPRAVDPREISASSSAELIVLVDDKNLVRECLARCLLSTREGSSVAMFATVADCARADVDSAEPAFVLYSIEPRGGRRPGAAGWDVRGRAAHSPLG